MPDLQQDKLFEIRVHSLPADKKRDLEEMLKRFTSSVSIPSRSLDRQSSGQGSSGPSSSAPKQSKSKGTSSSTSQQVDSGYASISNHDASSSANNAFVPSSASKENNIRSYLHDIPLSMLPKRPPVLSENAKAKLVVRKLEHLFTGKQATPGKHSQPVQQQGISKGAARADRKRSGHPKSTSGPEPSREARIMPVREADSFDASRAPSKGSGARTSGRDEATSSREADSISSDGDSPDQRPTRPLDLDIQRAQVPADNIQYIRHLGLPSPQIHPDLANKEDGWIYLNLLISMAQLHTMNVTPDFVKTAITDYSTKFELSKDGTKLRWIGGSEPTLLSSDTGSAFDSSPSSSDRGEGASGSARNQSGTSSEVRSILYRTYTPAITGTSVGNGRTTSSQPSNKLAYHPIRFLRRNSSSEEEYVNPHSEYFSSPTGGDGTTGRESGSNAVLERTSTSGSKARLADSGPITFYNNHLFYSDLSGDPQMTAQPNGEAQTASSSRETLGMRSKGNFHGESRHRHLENLDLDKMDISGEGSEDSDLPGLDLKPLSSAGSVDPSPLGLEVSGLGGVQPTDNFALRVRWNRTSGGDGGDAGGAHEDTASKEKDHYDYKVLSNERTDLPASQLPPPSYFWRHMSSDSDDEEFMDTDSDDERTSSSVDDIRRTPSSFLKHLSTGINESDSSEELRSDRAVSPNTLATRQREIHDLAIDDVPAGSSAATCGEAGDGIESPTRRSRTSPPAKRSRERDDAAQRYAKFRRLDSGTGGEMEEDSD